MTATLEQKLALRYIPKDSREITHPLGVAYIYEQPAQPGYANKTRYLVIAYTARAAKRAFHEAYGREELRDQRVAAFFSSLEAHEAAKATRKAESGRPHTLKVGDILHHSWGWEQTQCDYYQITAVTAHGATIREIESATVPESVYQHGMADMRVAVPNAFIRDARKVKIDGYNRVCASEGTLRHGCCNLWDGKPNYCSWYA